VAAAAVIVSFCLFGSHGRVLDYDPYCRLKGLDPVKAPFNKLVPYFKS